MSQASQWRLGYIFVQGREISLDGQIVGSSRAGDNKGILLLRSLSVQATEIGLSLCKLRLAKDPNAFGFQ